MPKFTRIKLCRLSPLHVGTGRDSYDSSASELHSDTLTAALASMLASEGRAGEVEGFMSSLRLSSAFPFYGDVFFLPRLQGNIPIEMSEEEITEKRKGLKKVKYLETSLWLELYGGKAIKLSDVVIDGSFLMRKGTSIGKVSASQVSQRVCVGQDGEDAQPFFFDWQYFSPKAGLYCITDATGKVLDDAISLFKTLGECGIGSDKNVGGGKFEVETDTAELADPPAADASAIMSLYIPMSEEMDGLQLTDSRYSLLRRGGFIAGSSEENLRHLRKRSVYMFGVGSVFPTLNPLSGMVVDLRPSWNDENMHPVLRSGQPIVLHVKMNDND